MTDAGTGQKAVPRTRDQGRASAIDGASRRRDRDWLVPFLLLSMRERNPFGHDLAREIIAAGFAAVRVGEIYGVLRQMEGEGLVFCEREEPDSTLSLRRYGLTEAGGAYLDFLAHSYGALQGGRRLFPPGLQGGPDPRGERVRDGERPTGERAFDGQPRDPARAHTSPEIPPSGGGHRRHPRRRVRPRRWRTAPPWRVGLSRVSAAGSVLDGRPGTRPQRRPAARYRHDLPRSSAPRDLA